MRPTAYTFCMLIDGAHGVEGISWRSLATRPQPTNDASSGV